MSNFKPEAILLHMASASKDEMFRTPESPQEGYQALVEFVPEDKRVAFERTYMEQMNAVTVAIATTFQNVLSLLEIAVTEEDLATAETTVRELYNRLQAEREAKEQAPEQAPDQVEPAAEAPKKKRVRKAAKKD